MRFYKKGEKKMTNAGKTHYETTGNKKGEYKCDDVVTFDFKGKQISVKIIEPNPLLTVRNNTPNNAYTSEYYAIYDSKNNEISKIAYYNKDTKKFEYRLDFDDHHGAKPHRQKTGSQDLLPLTELDKAFYEALKDYKR